MDISQLEFAHVPTTGVRQAHETPIVLAAEDSLKGYGRLVDDARSFPIEIVRWPAQGWRPIDLNSGDQGGVTEGSFEFCWKGETCTREIMRSATVIYSGGATGLKRPLRAPAADCASAR